MARRYRRRFVRLADRLEVGSASEGVALIVTGQVMVNGVIVTNPNTRIASDAAVTVVKGRTLRGTLKLRTALALFNVEVFARVCLDVGAAAGGFTAGLLEAGAARVYAVDVGYGQLVSWLRQDRRVVNLERTNLADLGPQVVPEPIDVVCLDLSYLAIADALPQLAGLEFPGGVRLIALVKPTFELRAGSVVADEDQIAKAVAGVIAAGEACGWSAHDETARVAGARGAREMFVHFTRAGGVRHGG